ncbi:MAG: TonB-dependent receptor [Steroidobacteraceae bacterium]
MKRNAQAVLVSGAVALVLAAVARAQDAQPVAATGAGPPASPVQLQEVTVTGSRVITSNSNSPTPIMGVSTDQLKTADPGTLSEAVNLLPVFSGSRGLSSNPGIGDTAVQGGNGVADVLNLRNLGAQRTLILFDGQRIPPTLATGIVDVDMVPQALIQRVEVVTGGASAVYGSDAVSGVVNFITNKHFNGLNVNAQYGISQYDDDKTPDFSAVAGANLFGGRGHIEGSYEYRDDPGIPYRSDRSWDDLWSVEGAGTAASPYHLVSGVHLAGYPFGGLITSGIFKGQTFASAGVLGAFQNGEPTGTSCCQIGGGGGYEDGSMKASLRSQQLYGRFDYDFTDNLHGHVVAAANLKSNEDYGTYQQLANVTLSADNAFLPTADQQQLAAAGQSTFKLSELLADAPREQGVVASDQYYLNTGLDGDLGRYHWETSYNWGLTRMDTTAIGDLNEQNLAAALDAVVDPSSGKTVCAASLTNPTAYSGCAPLNVFGPGAASGAAINYILGDVNFVNYTREDDVDGQITGAPFSTWAGPVSMALSAEWRRMSYSADSNGPPSEYANCADLPYNCTPGVTTVWNQTFTGSGAVSESVSEGAIEFDAPLLEDLPLVKSLSLNGAARYTSYSTVGDYVTWKIGVDWHLSDDFRIRGTESRDIRAPTLWDLYEPTSVVPGTFPDALTGLAPYVPSINYGNPHLKAEIGKTTTAGFVWQPDRLPGASLSLDGYDITIDDAIVDLQGFNTALQNVCYSSGGTSPYCALQARPDGFTDTSPANAVTAWYIEPYNIAQIETYGADLEADYTHEILTRPFAVRLVASYQPHIYYRQPGIPTIDQGDAAWGQNGLTAAPSVQLTAFFAYEVTDKLTANLTEQWRNAMKESGVPGQVWIDNHVPSLGTTAVTLSYDLDKILGVGDSQVFVTVQNLFNSNPPPDGYYSASTDAGYYYEFSDNPVGRYYTVGFRFSL